VDSKKVENEQLRSVGLKVTLPRLKILKILEDANPRHISAEDVYRRLMETGDNVGLATVYRVLTQFESAGLVIRHTFTDGHAVFELNEQEHHDHLVCTACNKVIEFVDAEIEARQERIASEHNFQITDHNLYIYGYCQECQQTEPE
jgi:Fur family ferric uptake transcriptional regulator